MINLYNIDCMEYMKTMEDMSVDFTFTDIPYGEVNRESNGLRTLDFGKADEKTFDLESFLPEVLRVTKNSICIFCGKGQFSIIHGFFLKQKGTTRGIVWRKTNPSVMNGQYVYLSGIELGVWFKRSGAKVFNAHCKNTVFDYPSGNSKWHPTGKNVKLWKDILLDNTNEGDLVFDPCSGGGTTAVVCKENNRNFVGCELDKTFFENSIKRLEEIKNS